MANIDPAANIVSDVSAVLSMEDYQSIGKFFEGFLIPQL